jgi:hypothetical protein
VRTREDAARARPWTPPLMGRLLEGKKPPAASAGTSRVTVSYPPSPRRTRRRRRGRDEPPRRTAAKTSDKSWSRKKALSGLFAGVGDRADKSRVRARARRAHVAASAAFGPTPVYRQTVTVGMSDVQMSRLSGTGSVPSESVSSSWFAGSNPVRGDFPGGDKKSDSTLVAGVAPHGPVAIDRGTGGRG